MFKRHTQRHIRQSFVSMQEQKDDLFTSLNTILDLHEKLSDLYDHYPTLLVKTELQKVRLQLQTSIQQLQSTGVSIIDLYMRFGSKLFKADLIKAEQTIDEKEQKDGKYMVTDMVSEDKMAQQKDMEIEEKLQDQPLLLQQYKAERQQESVVPLRPYKPPKFTSKDARDAFMLHYDPIQEVLLRMTEQKIEQKVEDNPQLYEQPLGQQYNTYIQNLNTKKYQEFQDRLFKQYSKLLDGKKSGKYKSKYTQQFGDNIRQLLQQENLTFVNRAQARAVLQPILSKINADQVDVQAYNDPYSLMKVYIQAKINGLSQANINALLTQLYGDNPTVNRLSQMLGKTSNKISDKYLDIKSKYNLQTYMKDYMSRIGQGGQNILKMGLAQINDYVIGQGLRPIMDKKGNIIPQRYVNDDTIVDMLNNRPHQVLDDIRLGAVYGGIINSRYLGQNMNGVTIMKILKQQQDLLNRIQDPQQREDFKLGLLGLSIDDLFSLSSSSSSRSQNNDDNISNISMDTQQIRNFMEQLGSPSQSSADEDFLQKRDRLAQQLNAVIQRVQRQPVEQSIFEQLDDRGQPLQQIPEASEASEESKAETVIDVPQSYRDIEVNIPQIQQEQLSQSESVQRRLGKRRRNQQQQQLEVQEEEEKKLPEQQQQDMIRRHVNFERMTSSKQYKFLMSNRYKTWFTPHWKEIFLRSYITDLIQPYQYDTSQQAQDQIVKIYQDVVDKFFYRQHRSKYDEFLPKTSKLYDSIIGTYPQIKAYEEAKKQQSGGKSRTKSRAVPKKRKQFQSDGDQ